MSSSPIFYEAQMQIDRTPTFSADKDRLSYQVLLGYQVYGNNKSAVFTLACCVPH
jgi:hypothetical protein